MQILAANVPAWLFWPCLVVGCAITGSVAWLLTLVTFAGKCSLWSVNGSLVC